MKFSLGRWWPFRRRREVPGANLFEIVLTTLHARRRRYDSGGLLSEDDLSAGAQQICDVVSTNMAEVVTRKTINILEEQVRVWEAKQIDYLVAKKQRYAR